MRGVVIVYVLRMLGRETALLFLVVLVDRNELPRREIERGADRVIDRAPEERRVVIRDDPRFGANDRRTDR